MSALTDWDPASLQWEVSPVISIGEEGEHSKWEMLNPRVWVYLLPDFPSFSMLPAPKGPISRKNNVSEK